MAKCDNCSFEAKTVLIGDACPECGRLVGWPVPGPHSSAGELDAYDSEATDEQLGEAVKAVAERNYGTLLRRKRAAEEILKPAPAPPASGTDNPPNAEPSTATDPSVQPQPDGESDDGGDEGGSEAAETVSDDFVDTEEAAGI